MDNPFKNALRQLDRAVKVKTFSSDFLSQLKRPSREITVSIPLKMDDGTIKIFEGYRVQHSDARGPYKGGIRFHPETNMDEVRALAFWMSLKTAVAGIPMGGGKGGITVDPKELSKKELERLARGWVKKLYPVIGPKMDVPAPDVNTTPEIMSWMVDEYAKITGDKTGATFTGKPISVGGSEGRGVATGLGGYLVFDALHSAYGLFGTQTVAIQGVGNVGINAAKTFYDHGHKIVALSDSQTGIYNLHGLDPYAVEKYKKEKGSLKKFPGAETISNAILLTLPVDVLIPAALENQITAKNVSKIKAKMILELANGPTTPEADDILFKKKIIVVPDILANAGGVIVSTFEWEQNLAGQHWTEKEVINKLGRILKRETKNLLTQAKKLKTDLRRTAFIVALERIERAMKHKK